VEKTTAIAVTARPEAVAPSTPADTLFAVVRELMVPMLKLPMKDVEVASALNVSIAQARVWLQRLTEEGLIEKYKNRAVYVIRNEMLFRQLWLPSGQFPDPEDNA
jgi:predicted ArsR family transcriptional regulator